ncbi:MAG: class I SAM-dependent methyltransferase [Myxococcales bacterium]|nr:class I SAM-dependent methyltransferase [Myxococcales bacterium]
MSLARATVPLAGAPFLPAGPPYSAAALRAWAGVEFDLPPLDPRLRALHSGGAEPSPALANLAGYVDGWARYPHYLDTLAPDSPVHEKKLLERALTLHRWRAMGGLATLEQGPMGGNGAPPQRILDLGCGIGRFACWFLDRGHEVTLVDGDLRSLRHAVWHAAGGRGALDAWWTTAELLPPVAETGPFDIAVLAEILNYVERPEDVIRAVSDRLTPDAAILFSVEARFGWALATDVAPGLAEGFFGGLAHRSGDRHVRCYTEIELHQVFAGWSVSLAPSHWVLSGPFEMAVGADVVHGVVDDEAGVLARMLDWEDRFEAHPVSAPLHRAWVGVARRRPANG